MMGVDIIGMGLSGEDLTNRHEQIIRRADLLVGGIRHLEQFQDLAIETLPISKDIALVVETVRERMGSARIVVLASGDPLFFGIGSTLVRALGKEAVTFHPNVSSLAAAFSAIKEPWQDARLISLHGREVPDLVSILKTHSRIGILTDHTRTPGWIAQVLLDNPIPGVGMWVLERLGTKEQAITWHDDMAKVAAMGFATPNVVVVKQSFATREEDSRMSGSTDSLGETLNQAPVTGEKMSQVHGTRDRTAPAQGEDSSTIWPGMPDERFVHEKGLITKAEVRSISLSKLKLVSHHFTVWDLGAGSGSVGIEVSAFVHKGRVVAVEKNENRLADIRANVARFGVTNLDVVHGNSLGVMDQLPDPDRIFIGGGGQDLLAIIQEAGKRLKPSGVMVVNTVLLQNMEPVLALLKKMGFRSQLIQVQVSKSTSMPVGERLEALNPVWVISGEKPKRTNEQPQKHKSVEPGGGDPR
ncbi:MAG: precorrin-6y C5,15-methyltransferase (decarboxylating) subunit CbiE [Desulfobacterium sp.]|nr:precorrin-6y C5,15-methyltransferase (decarboxylating) subunit CbiE [Desulfobacterium sp.]